jgi:hypothetical protein
LEHARKLHELNPKQRINITGSRTPTTVKRLLVVPPDSVDTDEGDDTSSPAATIGVTPGVSSNSEVRLGPVNIKWLHHSKSERCAMNSMINAAVLLLRAPIDPAIYQQFLDSSKFEYPDLSICLPLWFKHGDKRVAWHRQTHFSPTMKGIYVISGGKLFAPDHVLAFSKLLSL